MGIAMRLAVALVAGACLTGVVTGCTKTANGSPQWAKNEASRSVEKSDTEDLLLSPGDVGDVVGADLPDVFDTDEPFKDGDLEECEVLGPVGLAAILGAKWDGFHFRKLDDQLDEDLNADHFVAEVAIVYPDADAAAAAFEASTTMVQECGGTQRKTSAGHTWASKIEQFNDHSITWTEEQTDLVSEEWRCAGDERRRNNVVLRVLTCSGGDDGPAHSAAIANEMSNKVWDLSSPQK